MKKLLVLLTLISANSFAQTRDGGDDGGGGDPSTHNGCPTVFADPYTFCKEGGITYLNATPGFDTYSWSPAGNVSNPSIANPTTTIPGTYTVTASVLIGSELVVNGDFSAGNAGFSSGHTYTTSYAPCNYYVDAIWFGSYFPGLPDHTATTDNMFMHIDGCNPATMIWEQTMSVTPGNNYTFSFWASDADVAQPNFEIHFIGDVTGDNVISTQAGIPYDPNIGFNWNQYSVPCWYADQNNTVTIRVINLETASYGNDFGLDDFSFRQCCESSYTVNALATMGMNLFTNWDFSAGNTGFTSGHTYSTTYAPCNYYVDAIWFGSFFPGLLDHTPTSDNMFMHIDGCNPATMIYEQTINVQPGTVYNFSFWASDADVAQPKFEVHFIGDVTGDNIVLMQAGNPYPGFFNWSEYGVPCWYSDQNNIVTVRIINQETAYNGNDFGLDDFSFRECCNRDECCRYQGRKANPNAVAVENIFEVFPNPGNGNFEIKLDHAGVNVKAELMNVLGETVDTFIFSGNTYKYSPKHALTPGVYMLKVTNNGVVTSERIVVE